MIITRKARGFYPTFHVETDNGPVEVAFTNGEHASVHTTGHVNDDRPLIRWRNRELLSHVHLYAPNWDDLRDGRPYVTYRDSWSDAAPTAVAFAVRVSVEAVRAVLAAHPDVLREAARHDLTQTIAQLDRDIEELHAKLKELRAKRARALKALGEVN